MIELDEEWRDIPGYEGFYQASSMGRIRSLGWVDSLGRTHRGCVLSPGRSHNGGYLTVILKGRGTKKNFTVHRLVALAFLGEPNVLQTDVCHNNAIKWDNRVSNLRWGTRSENLKEHAMSGRYRNQNTQKTHCIRGHEFNDENTYLWTKPGRVNPSRICRKCAALRQGLRRNESRV